MKWNLILLAFLAVLYLSGSVVLFFKIRKQNRGAPIGWILKICASSWLGVAFDEIWSSGPM